LSTISGSICQYFKMYSAMSWKIGPAEYSEVNVSGLSSFTKATNLGLYAGAKPKKDCHVSLE